MNNEQKEKLKIFLREYPNPMVRVITTLKPSCVSFIKPVRGIFGPEIHCRAEDAFAVRKELTDNAE